MASQQNTRVIQTSSGPVKTLVADGLIHARNIRYASAERFQPPQAVKPWTEVRDCTEFAPRCPQLPFRFEFVLGPLPSTRPHDENCLTLTVIAPANAKPDARLPVLIWYHGGANIAGSADMNIMDCSDLSRRGAISVVVQYRLGIFGCLPIDNIAQPNLQLQDQIAALKWTHDHIASFGGDPSQVTLMGQSAGGSAVYTLMLSEDTVGLYQRAIIQSAPFAVMLNVSKEHALQAKRASELLGGTPESAAALSTDALLQIQQQLMDEAAGRGANITAFFPAWGKFPLLPQSSIRDRLALLATQHKVQLLVTWTADDALPFVVMNPYGKVISGIPMLGGWIVYLAGMLATSFVFRRGGQNLYDLYHSLGGNVSKLETQFFPKGSWLRACHCMELPFMFGDWTTWAKTPLLNGPESEETVARVAPAFKDMIVGFVSGRMARGQNLVLDSRFSKTSWKTV